MLRVFATLILALMIGPACAAKTICEGTHVMVEADSEADIARLCLGAGNGLALLQKAGLDTSSPISILATDATAIDHHAAEVGSYDTRDRLVRMRTYAGYEKLAAGTMFRVPMEEALYISFVTHEIAHAVIHANAGRHHSGRVAQEYIAYAVQLASMPESLRARILARYDLAAFDKASEINETYLLIDPHAFAVKVYLHYVRPENGTAFLRRLLDRTATLGGNGR